MKLRFDNFRKYRPLKVDNLQHGHCKRVSLALPHHAMLSDLDPTEVQNILQQCQALLQSPKYPEDATIYLSGITTIEEVTNE